MATAAKKTKPTLEDYIFDMETRPPDNGKASEGDLWTQLQQKEADLVLAAELGKALLEKNEELAKQQEKIIEEYSTKLENLEQEKHVLRRKLSMAQSDGDQRVLELQADLKEFQTKLEAQEQNVRQAEREKTLLIEELTAQNARLTSQLQEANHLEAQLTAQLQEVRDQYSLRNTSLQDHVSSLESLKDELRLVAEKKSELEKRLQACVRERDALNAALEEASDRIHSLERHAREQETKLQTTIRTLDRLQRENNTLTERLEYAGNQGSPKSTQGPRSLLAEMECEEELDATTEDHQNNQHHLHPIVMEAKAVYKQLKALCGTLKSTHDDDSGLHSDLSLGSMDNTISSQPSDFGLTGASDKEPFRQGMLSATADDLMRSIMALDSVHFKAMLDQARTTNSDQEDELRRRQDIIMELESKLSVLEVELSSALEERDQARKDASQSSLAQDEAVAQARLDRDNAVSRRTKAEVDLAKTRVELMQANGQLLEAIQQKVELSQQLEQWQMDMHELIEEQMKMKLNETNRSKQSKDAPPVPKRTYRILSLFQR
ncbi:bicaudal D-related protein homolog [Phlebotomus argentipes]|uniref:bicaudal D-related protein homolog n=1 Tax=Phlebotomus argentipes TaxID=94469 RepID=UPI00289367F5|nr:bicaudal D-related protein homolog [Phlebotomus argentipes]